MNDSHLAKKRRPPHDPKRALAEDPVVALVKLEVVELELARLELLVERPGLLLELLGEVLVLLVGANPLFGCLLPSCVPTNTYTVS